MRNLILFLIPVLSFAQSYEDYKSFLIKEEGNYNAVYFDKMGNKTIGIGHKVLPGEKLVYISDDEIDTLFQKDFNSALESAKKLVPNFDKHNPKVKIAIVSMVYNLGHGGFFKFKNFRAALARMDYNAAAGEISNSLWAKQLPKRSERIINILKGV